MSKKTIQDCKKEIRILKGQLLEQKQILEDIKLDSSIDEQEKASQTATILAQIAEIEDEMEDARADLSGLKMSKSVEPSQMEEEESPKILIKRRSDIASQEIEEEEEEEDDEPVIKRTSKRHENSSGNSTFIIGIVTAIIIYIIAFWVGNITGYNRGYEDCQKDLIEITESYK